MSEPSVVVSDATAQQIVQVLGEQGRAWLAALDGTVAELRERWSLREVGAPFPGNRTGLVAPAVARDGRALVFKVAADPDWAVSEAAALAHWDGRGAVSLVASDEARGALLLARVEPGEPLSRARLGDEEEAHAVAEVIAGLPGGRPPGSLPTLVEWLRALRPREGTLPGALDAAREEARQLASVLLSSTRGTHVLHGDLHPGNILRGGSGWIAADPKGVIGPREAEPAAFLRNPWSRILADPAPGVLLARRVDAVVDRLGYDRDRVVAWARVLGVLSAVWSWEDGAAEVEVEGALGVATVFQL